MQRHEITPVINASTWDGADINDAAAWRFELSVAEIDEIDAALERLSAAEAYWRDMTVENFPVPVLAKTLSAISEELERGCGMARLSGLPAERYGEADLRRLWWGIGLHLGTPVFQDFQGQLMRDITDLREDTDTRYGHHLTDRSGENFTSSKARTLSNGALRYHTDRCDVVALLCVHAAETGGVNHISSIAAIHNVILERRPDLLEKLYAPLARSRLGEEAGGENEVYNLPVFGRVGDVLTSHYSRTYVEAAQEMAGVAPLSEAGWAALDLLAEVADEVAAEMVLAPGEMQFLNNHAVYHARTAYTDPENGPRRTLYRLWLSMPNSRPLPDDHAVLWRHVTAGAVRGGISQV